MIVKASAPTRLSLFGGGTDVEPYASTYGGLVINIAINLRAENNIYTKPDNFPNKNNILPPLGSSLFMEKIFQHFKLDSSKDLEYESYSEAPLESGLGTSAASAVATIGAINRVKRLGLSKMDIALKAWEIEVNEIGLFGGSQDQVASSFGGVNVITYKEKGVVDVMTLSPDFIQPLLPYIVLFYTGTNRKSSSIQEGFKHLNKWQVDSLNNIKGLAEAGINAIANKDFEIVGSILDESWTMKKKSNKGVTNKTIDTIYNTAIAKGAWGGKVLGAGGGGHMYFIVPPEKRSAVVTALSKLSVKEIDFSVDWNGLETRIL